MADFEKLPQKELLALDPLRDANGASRSVVDTMTITRLQQAALLNPQRQAETQKESLEVRTEKKIVELEGAMTGFETQLLPLIAKVQNPQLQTTLRNPFHVFRANKSNPLRNFEKAKIEGNKNGIPPEAVMLSLPDQRHFGHILNDKSLEKMHAIAGFAPMQRSLVISENFDLTNTLNRLTMYHEMIHVMHQAVQRTRNMRAFIAFNAAPPHPKVIINEEFDAYGLELEIMDLLLNGQMRNEAQKGQKLDPEKILESLELRPDQIIPATFLSTLAALYFRGGDASKGQFPNEYKELVFKAVQHDGLHCFAYGQPNVP
jgi:hypothetical protein